MSIALDQVTRMVEGVATIRNVSLTLERGARSGQRRRVGSLVSSDSYFTPMKSSLPISTPLWRRMP
jgi:hypothetical protein